MAKTDSIVIDARDAVLGRLATAVAKKLNAGESISIVNASHAIITGDPVVVRKKYLFRRGIGSPQHGPFYPKQPQAIVRRAVRGMMAYKSRKGRAAFKKLRVYAGTPLGVSGAEKLAVKPVKSNFVTVGEIAKSLGWDGRE